MDSGVPKGEKAAKRQRGESSKEKIAQDFSSDDENPADISSVDEKSGFIFYGFDVDGSYCLKPPTSLAECVLVHPYYSTHAREGATLMDPECIDKDRLAAGLMHVYVPYFDSEEFFEDEGPPSFAFILGGEGESVLLAVNHPPVNEPGSSSTYKFPPNVIALHSHILATISGKLAGSKVLLKRLKKEFLAHVNEKGGMVSPAEASRLMANLLSNNFEMVGLIAGWNFITRAPELYRVDGMGVVIKGHRFASGCGVETSYFNMRLRGGWFRWDIDTALKSIIHVAHSTRKGQHVKCTHIPDGVHGEDFVTLYMVDHGGWRRLTSEIDVNKEVTRCGFRRSALGEFVFEVRHVGVSTKK